MSCTLRHLVAKIAASKVREELTSLLELQQLRLGIRGGGGAESALHAAWMYAGDLDENHWIMKLNFKNTFNSAQG